MLVNTAAMSGCKLGTLGCSLRARSTRQDTAQEYGQNMMRTSAYSPAAVHFIRDCWHAYSSIGIDVCAAQDGVAAGRRQSAYESI